MILRRLADAIREQSWFTVVLEVLIVVVGILIGLQLDGWNEQRKDRLLEQRYLERIYDELALDIRQFETGTKLAESRRAMGERLLDALEDSSVVREDPAAFVISIEQAGYTFLPAINDSTFEELRFAGDLAIIRNDQLRASITGYYKRIEQFAQWDYIRQSTQNTYYDRVLGILTPQQQQITRDMVIRIDDPDRNNQQPGFEEEAALQALDRMRANQEFVVQIPRATNHHTAIRNLKLWRDAAEELRNAVGAELGKVSE